MSTYRVTVDTFSGSPYVRVRRISNERRVHHKRELARLDAHFRGVWGDKAGAIRHRDGVFTVVWCAHRVAPFPGGPEGYGLREFYIDVDMT